MTNYFKVYLTSAKGRQCVIAKNKFHIFDIPFMILCGEEIKDKVTEILVKYNDKEKSKEPLSIAWS